ncbi:MAG: hypothetical protein JXR91_01675 [Deltaproteobacteria bacterium]|nr:hypothetical protein [Deltaproteobacteria bacterium]
MKKEDLKNLYEEKTRMAKINTSTGIEILENQKNIPVPVDVDDDATFLFDGEKTVIGNKKSKPLYEKKITEEYIPVNNMRATGEITSLWIDETNRFLNFVKRFVNNKKIAVLVITIAAGLVVGGLNLSKKTVYAEERVNRVDIEKNKKSVKIEKDKINTIKPDKNASELDAVNALLSGEFKKALGQYKGLMEKEPDNNGFKTGVRILKIKLGEPL